MRAKKYIKKYLPDLFVEVGVNKIEFKRYIRNCADEDDGLENVIFEVGLSEIAHRYFKEDTNKAE